MDVSKIRREYLKDGLSRDSLQENPVDQFSFWFEQARKTSITDPTAMVLSTVDSKGQPSQRTVLLKYYDNDGFVFFTNYSSRKAVEIGENDRVSLLFMWLELERQVIIGGTASKISAKESAKYFLTRPKESQVAAWISSQSHVISSRKLLLQKFYEMKKNLGEGSIELPSFWGGYKVYPETIEFWQGRENRLHDRFMYTKDESSHGDSWDIARLAP